MFPLVEAASYFLGVDAHARTNRSQTTNLQQLTGLPQRGRGEITINVTMSIDKDGILTVEEGERERIKGRKRAWPRMCHKTAFLYGPSLFLPSSYVMCSSGLLPSTAILDPVSTIPNPTTTTS